MNKISLNKWKTTDMGNQVLDGKGFHISYNASPGVGVGMWGSDDGSDETALVNHKGKRIYYILNGDFRKDYEKLVKKGYKACKEFYNNNKEKFDSSWSRK